MTEVRKPRQYDEIVVQNGRMVFRRAPGAWFFSRLDDGAYRQQVAVFGGGGGKSIAAAELAEFLSECCNHDQVEDTLKDLGWIEELSAFYNTNKGGRTP